MGETYAAAGVDIETGDAAVEAIKSVVRSTYRPEVLGDIGGFGGLFAMPTGYRDPVMVAATDGVGTKIELARQTDGWDTIGVDLVAMCVDDLICQGAAPLFFLDYLSTGSLDPDRVRRIVSGVAAGCRAAGCALIGGEMAEHPGIMGDDDIELVGFAVGMVDRDRLITGEHVQPGDAVIGLPSPGLRSNGYSLARRVLADRGPEALGEPAFEGSERTLGDELLLPSVIYTPAVLELLDAVDVHAIAHVTGGGLPGNLGRVLPSNTDAQIDGSTWERPRIFDELQRLGSIPDDEMRRVFNLGVGMVVVVPRDACSEALRIVGAHHPRAVEIGAIVDGTRQVILS